MQTCIHIHQHTYSQFFKIFKYKLRSRILILRRLVMQQIFILVTSTGQCHLKTLSSVDTSHTLSDVGERRI
jgi:hypothetical protein